MRVDPSLGEIVGRIHAQSIARFDELHPTPYRARARSKKVAARICALISSSLAAVVAVATVLGLLGMPLNSLSEPVSLETAPAVRAASNASLAGARLYVPSLTCRAMACGAELAAGPRVMALGLRRRGRLALDDPDHPLRDPAFPLMHLELRSLIDRIPGPTRASRPPSSVARSQPSFGPEPS